MNIFLTGGTGGIGREIIRSLADDKKNAIFFTYCQNSQQALQIEKKHPNAKAVACDFRNVQDLELVKEKLGRVEFDVIVNTAFPKLELVDFARTSWASVQGAIDVGVRAHFELTREFSGPMKRRRTGAIINILSSVVLDRPPAQMMAYVIAKYAFLGFHQTLLSELVKYGLRVNAVSPSMVKTDFLSNLPDHYVNMVEQSTPGKRLVGPADVAEAVKFLLSAKSESVNGVNLPVTGGARA